MKQIAINDYLIVECPSEALSVRVRSNMHGGYFLWSEMPVGRPNFSFGIPEDYEVIGKCSEISEDVAKEIVASIFGLHYFDYMNPKQGEYAPGYILDSALDSFSTYLQSHSLTPQSAWLLKKI